MTKTNRVYNLRKDTHDSRDFKLRLLRPEEVLPPVVDNRHLFSPVRDQGQLGSCSAFSSVGGAFEMLQRKALMAKEDAHGNAEVFGANFEQLSTLFQYQNTLILEGNFGHDEGATIRGAVKAIATYGATTEKMWPYRLDYFGTRAPEEIYNLAQEHKIKLYAAIDSVHGIKAALAHGLPVILGIMVYSSFESEAVARTGMVPVPDVVNEECLGGHAVCLAGYNETGFIMRNSWGPGWGMGGYCVLPYAMFTNMNSENGLVMDPWVITK